MKIYENKSQFGWEDDGGIGERLIQQIIKAEKTATAGPKDLYSAGELKDLYDSVGKHTTVIDKDQRPRCNIRILEVFETRFGSLDPRLVQGEGYGSDAEAFRESHRKAWVDLVKKGQLELSDETILVVELFELVANE
jgi:uncharacterized protein YhfF